MSINRFLRPAGVLGGQLDNGATGTVTLRNYQHATRIFTDANFRLSPKYNFLFYVEFDLNPLITSVSNISAQELGMIVKTVQLPKYTIDTKTHNAYNRVNIVQNKIKYDPVTITFHDDQADNVKNFWYDYYSFYYRDPDYADATYASSHKYQNRPSFQWGYSPKAAVGYNNANGSQPYQYIQAIRIYSLYQKNFSQYELINPTITKFEHGDHANGENGVLSHSMTVSFETVKYYTGYTTPDTVGGYIDLHYDNTPSPISPAVGNDIIDNGLGSVAHVNATTIDLASINFMNTTVGTMLYNNSVGVTGIGAAGISGGVNFSSTSGGINAGGFSIPNLGSLPTGLPSSAGLLSGATATLAGTVGNLAGQATGAVVGGIAKGLGSNGQAIVGLTAAAISNPKLFLKTAENMAIGIAGNYLANKLTEITTPYITKLGTTVAGAVSEYITTPISAAWTTAGQYANYLSYAPEGMTFSQFQFGYSE